MFISSWGWKILQGFLVNFLTFIFCSQASYAEEKDPFEHMFEYKPVVTEELLDSSIMDLIEEESLEEGIIELEKYLSQNTAMQIDKLLKLLSAQRISFKQKEKLMEAVVQGTKLNHAFLENNQIKDFLLNLSQDSKIDSRIRELALVSIGELNGLSDEEKASFYQKLINEAQTDKRAVEEIVISAIGLRSDVDSERLLLKLALNSEHSVFATNTLAQRTSLTTDALSFIEEKAKNSRLPVETLIPLAKYGHHHALVNLLTSNSALSAAEALTESSDGRKELQKILESQSTGADLLKTVLPATYNNKEYKLLVESFLKHENPEIRTLAFQATLSMIYDQSLKMKSIQEALVDPSPAVYKQAALDLQKINPELYKKIFNILSDIKLPSEGFLDYQYNTNEAEKLLAKIEHSDVVLQAIYAAGTLPEAIHAGYVLANLTKKKENHTASIFATNILPAKNSDLQRRITPSFSSTLLEQITIPANLKIPAVKILEHIDPELTSTSANVMLSNLYPESNPKNDIEDEFNRKIFEYIKSAEDSKDAKHSSIEDYLKVNPNKHRDVILSALEGTPVSNHTLAILDLFIKTSNPQTHAKISSYFHNNSHNPGIFSMLKSFEKISASPICKSYQNAVLKSLPDAYESYIACIKNRHEPEALSAEVILVVTGAEREKRLKDFMQITENAITQTNCPSDFYKTIKTLPVEQPIRNKLIIDCFKANKTFHPPSNEVFDAVAIRNEINQFISSLSNNSLSIQELVNIVENVVLNSQNLNNSHLKAVGFAELLSHVQQSKELHNQILEKCFNEFIKHLNSVQEVDLSFFDSFYRIIFDPTINSEAFNNRAIRTKVLKTFETAMTKPSSTVEVDAFKKGAQARFDELIPELQQERERKIAEKRASEKSLVAKIDPTQALSAFRKLRFKSKNDRLNAKGSPQEKQLSAALASLRAYETSPEEKLSILNELITSLKEIYNGPSPADTLISSYKKTIEELSKSIAPKDMEAVFETQKESAGSDEAAEAFIEVLNGMSGKNALSNTQR